MPQNKNPSTVILFDNGSMRPDSTRSLRRLAGLLSTRIGREVLPISLLHSSAVPAEELDGRQAEILEPALQRLCNEGRRHFILIPLFIGPSAALTTYLPDRISVLKTKWPEASFQMAPPLVDAADGSAERLAEILCDGIRATISQREISRPRVALVDHGSPQPSVTAVRDELAERVARSLGPEAALVAPASMERRAGPEYAFNEPLLSDLLGTPPFDAGEIVVSLLFISPGRHAGPGGDIESICRKAEAGCPSMRVTTTALLGEHPGLIDLLATRFTAVLESRHSHRIS